MNTPLAKQTVTLHDRALGAYLGFACGDALGATLELMTPEQIQQSFGVHRDIIGGGWLRLPSGDVTDDTEMALTLGQALLDGNGCDPAIIAEHFSLWLQSHPPDIGETCLRGIRRYTHTGELCSPYSDNDTGNGACMRVFPVALATLYRDDLFEDWLCQQNHITHHNMLSDQASIMIGTLVKQLIREQTTLTHQTIEQFISRYPQFEYRPYPGLTSGYIVETIQTVLHFFENTDTLEDCIIQTVNQGGDADTTGALVGMLAGAKYGVSAIPTRWLSQLNTTIYQHISNQTQALLILAERLQLTT